MQHNHRFTDEKLTIHNFYDQVLVVCPACKGKAIADARREQDTAILVCDNCGYNSRVSTLGYMVNSNHKRTPYKIITAAHRYFGAPLWLQASYRGNVLWAYNYAHLTYLERYIAATLRESIDRDGFTMVEKLPPFIQSAKNREGLLKLIAKMKAM